MTIIIDKSNSKNTLKIPNEKFNRKVSEVNLTVHFGKLRRNFDGLEYQMKARENED